MSPYPNNPEYQLAFFWFLGVLELVIFIALVGTVFNQYRLHRGRFIMLTFLASAQAIVYKAIDRAFGSKSSDTRPKHPFPRAPVLLAAGCSKAAVRCIPHLHRPCWCHHPIHW